MVIAPIILGIALIETISYLLLFGPYYRHGPLLRREEWQTAAKPAKARGALLKAVEEGPIKGRERGDTFCLRLDEWRWGLVPRLALKIDAIPQGAIFVCEVRPFLGGALFGLALVSFLAEDGHFVLAPSILAAIIFACIASWRAELRRLGRLGPVSARLRQIGLQICGNCGYDLYGLDLTRPCPECGHTADRLFGTISSEQLIWKLEDRAYQRRLHWWASVVFGIPLTLIGPFLISGAFWVAAFMWTRDIYPFAPFFIVIVAIMLPLLFRTELATGGRYFDESYYALRSSFPDMAPLTYSIHSPHGARWLPWVSVLMNLEGTTAMILELFLAGPRLFLSGYRHLRQANALKLVKTFRAADVVATLAKRQIGIAPNDLLSPDEKLEDIVPVLAWLGFYGWLGASENADRVFLYTESRRILFEQ